MSTTARRFAKRLLAHGLVRTGCWDVALRSWARRDATVILTYHRVLDKWEPALDYSQPGMVVTVSTFERQLAFLTQHFDIVPLGQLLDGGTVHRPARRPRCVITFDDGWRDNYDLAFPILRKRDVPATIFLTTDFVGTERAFWHTELIHLLLHGELSPFLGADPVLARYPEAVRDQLRRCAGSARISCAEEADTLIETIKATCAEDVIHDLVDTLVGAAGFPRPLFPGRRFFLDWDQVGEMAANGFEIGSHGCSHRIMTRLSPEDANDELVRSKAEIEGRVGRPVQHFAFPNENANDTLVGLAARAGYRTLCVAGAGEGAARSGIRALRRTGIHEGVCIAGTTYDDALLGLCLLRAPKSQPA
jgi:peptidoglycan/xylan/chitin deacetylase (PgdA/CDA1 family)